MLFTDGVFRERGSLLLLLLVGVVYVDDVVEDDLGLEQLLVVGLAVDHALVAHVRVQAETERKTSSFIRVIHINSISAKAQDVTRMSLT